MECAAEKNKIIEKLQQQILSMQGFRQPSEQHNSIGLGPMELAFPNGIFPVGAIHEFLSDSRQSAAVTGGFMAGLLGKLMARENLCLWIGAKRKLYPAGLPLFGIDPEKMVFIDLAREKEALWAIEEALKCEAIGVVVGELSELDFAQSRRLQLAVEQSRVTGLMHCYDTGRASNTTAVSRWRISPLASTTVPGMPGFGHPRWQVELLKVRNGKPGAWQMEWRNGHFYEIDTAIATPTAILERTA